MSKNQNHFEIHDFERRLTRLFRNALGRAPVPDELQRCRKFYHKHVAAIHDKQQPLDAGALPIPLPGSASPQEAAVWTDFAMAMLNLSEFIYID